MKHVCHADGCSVIVQPKLLMCKRHWRMVPGDIKSQVYRNYRPGQEVDKKPSKEYLLAYAKAVNAVAEHQGKPIPFTSLPK